MNNSYEFNKRKNEILDVAEKLFVKKGYDKCTVSDILSEVGIAKGTFYYYFRSKEEVLDSIIDRITEIILKRAKSIAFNKEYSPIIKMLYINLSMNVQSEVEEGLIEEFHKPQNALMHQKSLSLIVTKVTPILAEVVEEGINEGIFKTDFPEQYMQIFLTASITLLDDGIFKVNPEEQHKILRALVALLEKMLGVEDGTLWNIAKQHWE